MNNIFYKDLLEMSIEALEVLDKYERGIEPIRPQTVFEFIRRVAVPCLDGRSVNREILKDIPLREQSKFTDAVFAMANLSMLGGEAENRALKSSIYSFKSTVLGLSQRNKRSVPPRIFYSWQSTLKSSANRGLIKGSLEIAIENINREMTVDSRGEAVLDSDTANTPGSPDIIRTILSKIDVSTIFIADITMVNANQPNSNVMFELGYAFKALGEDNIIMLFNEHYGSPKDLPFDLGLKRAMLYRCDPGYAEKSKIRQELAKRLKMAIDLILESPAD